ncbi:hypothetical protein SCB71_13690 [Herbiconiux sp. KACC 21604]|uniref:hypothetical protein n=1 Tax=unclassified Herbiconiux TaxID=2618217 RepID=UPI0014911E1C|nr:hypothetical protein [Herbiconiux sp. SALV-R1]QJU54207.1 hypothetical protein HL652_11645 [Herbiconiux sp. SALV-R1]WPO85264.1 hypothetical protein SCB71_13690 [Herbiconiux sp. KACC 21604]
MTRQAKARADEAARVEALLDELDPEVTPADDPHELRRIGLALREAAAADSELRGAVRAARQAGYTWAEIGLTLGTTRQAAQARFREAPGS